ncbi:hypothetical protein HYPSUDRAFT_87987 [Hypholoma sublateritium FD-334 SS-4]|uniref:DUF6533 domain-containing protein n=1 Tax=Hypholoma sublateritium (strain FD-334 SS-4) TaxID=945553 RepID=A0A0D2L465_HYPSF|nr:hypothetical protein HYPSUDRAFT_87987 [Hypholoma sublateritium FD-334 SS-4]
MDTAQVFQLIVRGLYDIQITQFTQLGSATVIVFDHLITLGDEVDLIWKSSWTLGKILFLLNRYYSLAAVVFNNYAVFAHTVDHTVCQNFYRWQGWTGLIACLLAEAILQMRLYALYSLNKKVLVLMLSCWVLCLGISAYVMYTVLAKLTVTAMTIPNGMFCVPGNVSPHFYTFWIPMLAFEALLCTLAVIRGLRTYRSNRTSIFHSGRELVAILIRDSLIYFVVIGAAYLTCLLVWVIAPVGLLDAPVGFSLAMSCVLANRVVLNIRSVNRNANTSRLPVTSQKSMNSHNAVFAPEALTSFEMNTLRKMRVEQSFTEVIDIHDEPVDLPFVVL